MPSDLPETYILWLDFAKLAFCSTLIAQTKEVGIAMNSKQDNDFVEFWYRQYSTYLFRYACLFVDSHTAEEVVQETFRFVCEKGPLDQIEHPKTWLRKITEYVIKNRSREREKWMTMLVDAEKLPDDFWGRHEDETNIELEYAGVVSRDDLHLLKLLAVDGYTYVEAAKEFEITSEACRKRAKRAADKLRKKLEGS